MWYFCGCTGYLSCCRFLSDTEIITSSGDCTWYEYSSIYWTKENLNWFFCTLNWIKLAFLAYYGTLRRGPRRLCLPDIRETACPSACPQTSSFSSQGLVTSQLSCGTSGRAPADRPLEVTRVTSMPLGWEQRRKKKISFSIVCKALSTSCPRRHAF